MLKKRLLTGLGWLSFSLGIIGILLPLMPTTIFWIIAVWLWAKGSPHLVQKVYENPSYGHFVKEFMEQGIIPRSAKIAAISSLTVSYLLIFFFTNSGFVINISIATVFFLVGLWIITRSEN